jgi:L-ascorbate metabolism protein UlaG (beta-lactamase superfamily)
MLRKNLRSHLIISILLFAALCTAAFGKIIYVDDDATGANDGTSWENAYVYLQDALTDANSAEKPVEIWVAQGIYKPHLSQVPILEFFWRSTSFELINDIVLKGGYSGVIESDPDTRDIGFYKTILSGDLYGDDVEVANPCDLMDEPTRAENSFHVVMANEINATAILEGFIITGGNADGPDCFNFSLGGGMYNLDSNPAIINCTFIGNTSRYGSGMYNQDSNPTITNCTFDGNTSRYGGGGGISNFKDSNPILTRCIFVCNYAGFGGGMANSYNSSPILTDCTFSENSSEDRGGGMENWENSSPTLINCIFTGNLAWSGGGMTNDIESSPTLTNCTFRRNLARDGGGMENSQNSSPILTNCSFSRNSAENYGGGMVNMIDSNPIMANCIFCKNTAGDSGGGVCNFASSPVLINCTFAQNSAENGNAIGSDIVYDYYRIDPNNMELINCILWDGGNEIWNEYGSPTIITYCNIQGDKASIFDPSETVIWGKGNIDVDPLFVSFGYLANVNDPNTVAEPNDPNAVWIDGDYHLKSEAGRWDLVSESWIVDDVTSPCIDAGDPNSPVGDEPKPNGGRINMGAYGGTAEASKSPAGAQEIVYIQWLGHASVKVWTDDCIVYMDPQNLSISPHDATFVLVTHTHSDHYSPSDIAKVSNAQTRFIAPPDVVQLYGSGMSIAPWQTMEFNFVKMTAVPAYNINKTNHPKSNNWVGYIIELGGKRIYVAGDTDLIDEMKSLGDINVAFLPAGGTYTMNATEAAEATGYIKPDLAIPYHWGQVVGTLADAQRFVELARCPAMVMAVGETISSDNWPEYSPLIGHWALDEAEGNIAHDSAGDNHGKLYGGPVWQPAEGKIDGALLLDGIDDYVSTDFVLDPANGPFSVFAWINGGSAGQVVISQANGTGSGEIWLGADALLGKLMTGLVPPPAGRFVLQPLVSEFVITDNQWHNIGFVWDGSYRTLYADGAEVAKDTAIQNLLKSADGGLYIGAGKTLEPMAFFSGLIDDVRIYNMAVTEDEIGTLVH